MFACSPGGDTQNACAALESGRLSARAFHSGFEFAHDTYNGMGAASDGRIYYVLSSERHDIAGQVYVLDPSTEQIRHVGDLSEAAGEKGRNVIAQGKSHVSFVESDGKLYFATHTGYYSTIDGMEKMGIPPPGWGDYTGGHFLAFDLNSGKFEDLGIAPGGEGVLTMNMDTERRRIYGLTWPTGHLIRLDPDSGRVQDLGAYFRGGENGIAAEYRTICRSLAIDPRDGSVYFSTGEGTIYRLRCNHDSAEPVGGDDLRKDYFGAYNPESPGHMAYNWRQVFWNPDDSQIYGVHGNSGYLFRFDPHAERVEVLDRITSLPSKRSGMYDQFSYGYLGFTLGPDKRTIYYLTGGPVYMEGRRVPGKTGTAKGESKGDENLHLITWDIPTGRYRDHGPVFYENGEHPTWVNSIAVGNDGAVYTLARVRSGDRVRADLVRIPPVTLP
jgi:hypothetical protein